MPDLDLDEPRSDGILLTRADRAARTAALLEDAGPPCPPEPRTVLLLELAALNLDAALAIATSMTSRLRVDALDRPTMLDHVRSAYVAAVIALEPPLPADFLTSIAPPVRDAVRCYLRARPGSALPSG